MDATPDQLADFAKALTVAIAAAGMTLASVAEELDYSVDGVRLWTKADREPARAIVFELERLLGRKPGELSRLLGYLPVTARSASSVADAIESDPDLSAEARVILRAAHRAAQRF